jgi:hypothetical protein
VNWPDGASVAGSLQTSSGMGGVSTRRPTGLCARECGRRRLCRQDLCTDHGAEEKGGEPGWRYSHGITSPSLLCTSTSEGRGQWSNTCMVRFVVRQYIRDFNTATTSHVHNPQGTMAFPYGNMLSTLRLWIEDLAPTYEGVRAWVEDL